MNEKSPSPRIALIREASILQLKLLADGLRDAILIPVSLLAALVGLLRGGDEPDREYRRVLKLGRRSERWINLFGHQQPLGRAKVTGSMDQLLDRVEAVVLEQYRKGKTTAEARDAIGEALEEAHRGAESEAHDK